MATVELVYDAGCPNVGQARAQLLRAFAAAGRPARWHEWRSDDRALPAHARGLGSPSILVGGRDVVPVTNQAACCRVYIGPAGIAAVPPLETLTAALRGAAGGSRRSWPGLRAVGLWGPGVGVAFLPKLICPACWPAYAALASAVGLPFLLNDTALFWITLVAVVLIGAVVAWRASSRRGYAPLALVVIASAMVLAGKFLYSIPLISYAGATLLLAACVWNAWPRRTAAPLCPACTPDHTLQAIRGDRYESTTTD